MKVENTHISLEKFGKELKKQSRANLTRTKKNASKSLYESIDYETKEMPNSLEFSFNMLPYGDFVDKGVSGTKQRYNTPFKYTNEPPPFVEILKWVQQRRLMFRDNKGRFAKGGQRTLAFLIRRKIFTKGMKPTHFYSKPFDRLYEKLPADLIAAYQLDVQNFLAFARNNKRLDQ
jgi:hypothetical protein